MDTRRLEAFSDGVFAIAITLLVLDLRPTGTGSLTEQLLAAWPRYFAYVVSFLTIGIMWMNHHRMISHAIRVDRMLLALNLLLLMGVVAVPFPTTLVSEHLHGPGAATATVTYGLVMIAISAGFSGVWLYLAFAAAGRGQRGAREELRRSIPRFSLGFVGYTAGTLIAAFVSPVAALTIFGLIAVYYLFEHLPEPALESGR